MFMKTLVMDKEEYEVIDSPTVAASRALSEFYVRLGSPDDPFSTAGEQMMRLIIAAWQDLYPEQATMHNARIKDYQELEKTMHEQIKSGSGRNLASVPTPVYRMMRKIFPDFKMNNRDDFIKLVNKYPIFKLTAEKKGGFISMKDK